MVFARAPVPGRTKTRLIPALGEQGAAQLHARLIERTLATASAAEGAAVSLWCTPSVDDPCLQACGRTYGIPLHLQCGTGLGQRMLYAFDRALQRRPWAIVLGTDCPQLQTADLQQAIAILQSGKDAVIGPAYDGGYYLLGIRRTAAALFEDVPWGSNRVGSVTRQRLNELGWSWSSVTRRHDLDRPEDLRYFCRDTVDDQISWIR